MAGKILVIKININENQQTFITSDDIYWTKISFLEFFYCRQRSFRKTI
jgi:hypothetical protein